MRALTNCWPERRWKRHFALTRIPVPCRTGPLIITRGAAKCVVACTPWDVEALVARGAQQWQQHAHHFRHTSRHYRVSCYFFIVASP